MKKFIGWIWFQDCEIMVKLNLYSLVWVMKSLCYCEKNMKLAGSIKISQVQRRKIRGWSKQYPVEERSCDRVRTSWDWRRRLISGWKLVQISSLHLLQSHSFCDDRYCFWMLMEGSSKSEWKISGTQDLSTGFISIKSRLRYKSGCTLIKSVW